MINLHADNLTQLVTMIINAKTKLDIESFITSFTFRSGYLDDNHPNMLMVKISRYNHKGILIYAEGGLLLRELPDHDGEHVAFIFMEFIDSIIMSWNKEATQNG